MTSDAPGSDRLARLNAMHAAEPNDGFVLYALAQECHKLGRFAEAIAWYDRVMVADPKQFYAFFHKAKALEAAGRIGEVGPVLRDGLARARAAGDMKAASELQGFLDEIE